MHTAPESAASDNARSVGLKNRRLFILTALLCALLYAAIDIFPKALYHIFAMGEFVTLHVSFEFTAILVCFAVFIVGWYGYGANRNTRNLFIGVTFLAVGIFDFAHTLSYKGMPNFLSENTVSKASTYWVATQLTCSLALLLAAFTGERGRRGRYVPYLFLIPTLAVVTVVVVLVSYFPDLLPPMFIDGVGQTQTKIVLEWVIVFTFAAAAVLHGVRNRQTDGIVLLQLAIMISIFSELGFVFYKSAFDTYNLMGHIIKVIAYWMIFRALFLSSFERPYAELVSANEKIEQSLARIGNALASSINSTEVLQLIADVSSEMLGSQHGAVMLLKDGDLRVAAQKGMEAGNSAVPLAQTLAGEVLHLGEPMVLSGDLSTYCQYAGDASIQSAVAAPLVLGENIMGVIAVYSLEAGVYNQRSAELLASFARQAAAAIHNSISYARERAVAEALQRSLLPPAPKIPGLDIAVVYTPAEDAARVGGDLYDIFALDKEHVAIVIGDVCGHGLDAASSMAMASYMIKGFLSHGMQPGGALRHANQVLCKRASDDRQLPFVTLFAGVLHLPSRTLKYSDAGHPMPLIFGDTVDILDGKGDIPLGIEEETVYRVHTVDLSATKGMLLYTDGVVEARKKKELFGEDRLCDLCSQMSEESAASITATVVENVKRWSGMQQDDIALVLVKWSEL